MSRLFRAAAVVVAALMLGAPARADAVDLDAARREGKVVWYTSLPIALSQKLAGLFEQKTGYTIKTIAVGTGQALALAARGEADIVLAHAPALEKKYVADGKMLDRRLVMYNDFVIIGPSDDPAKIKGLRRASDAMNAIAATGSRFVSRGDNSGTHLLEKSLWKLAGVEPQGAWYIEAGQGMGATLGIEDLGLEGAQ